MQVRIKKGMNVRSTNGIPLGKVVGASANTFIVEKGIFFPKEHELRFDDIVDVRENEIIARLSQEAAVGRTEAATLPKPEAVKQPLAEPTGWKAADLGEGQDLNVALMEEQLYVEKSMKEKGAVRIHKTVVSEERKVNIPLKHEEIVVERVRSAEAKPGAHPFEDERYTIALHEEEFEVHKRPVVKEEVHVRRVMKEEQRAASATVRHEELEVEDEGRRGRADVDPNKKIV